MDRKNTEYPKPPEEFRSATEESAPLPPEFGASGQASAAPKRRRRLLAAAAALLLVFLLTARPRPAEALPEGPMRADPPPAASAEPDREPDPTPAPTPEPTPEPAPEPTPEPAPGCEIIYICFSSDYWVKMNFTAPEKILSVSGEIWETQLDSPEESFEVSEKDIALGSAVYRFDDAEVYRRHWDEFVTGNLYPELELRLDVQVNGEHGPETLHYTERVRPQLGWSLKYNEETLEADDYTFPGCFVLQTYEDRDPRIVLGGAEAAEPGAICVTAEIGGHTITADDCEIFVRDFGLNDYLPAGVPSLYNAFLVIPRPEGVEHGTAHFTVTQLLDGYGKPWVIEYDIEY